MLDNNRIDGKKVIIPIPVLLQGGTEGQTLNLVRVLHDADYRVTVCCYHEHDPVMVSEMRQAGAEVILMEQDRSVCAFTLISILKALFKSLSRILSMSSISHRAFCRLLPLGLQA